MGWTSGYLENKGNIFSKADDAKNMYGLFETHHDKNY